MKQAEKSILQLISGVKARGAKNLYIQVVHKTNLLGGETKSELINWYSTMSPKVSAGLISWNTKRNSKLIKLHHLCIRGKGAQKGILLYMCFSRGNMHFKSPKIKMCSTYKSNITSNEWFWILTQYQILNNIRSTWANREFTCHGEQNI